MSDVAPSGHVLIPGPATVLTPSCSSARFPLKSITTVKHLPHTLCFAAQTCPKVALDQP